jgi:hypothetical protein
MRESSLSCSLWDWLGMAMISGIGFLALLVLLLAAGALARYILTGSLR